MKIKKKLPGLLLALVLVLLFAGPEKAHALKLSGVSLGGPGSVVRGTDFQVAYSISSDVSMYLDLNFSVTNGSIVQVTSSVPDCINGSKLLSIQDGVTSISGVIVVHSDNDNDVTVTMSGQAMDINLDAKPVQASCVVDVKTQAEIDAESQKGTAAPQPSRAPAATTVTEPQSAATVPPASAESSAEETLPLAEESESLADDDASRALEESLLQAEYDSSVEESLSLAAEEESRSLEEKTAPVEEDGILYIPYEAAKTAGRMFYFAGVDLQMEAPEDYYQAGLVKNDRVVLAFKNASMADALYLVYGRRENETFPTWYFYNVNTEDFMRYEDVIPPVSEEEEEAAEETTEETVPETVREGSGFPLFREKAWFPYLVGLVAFALGVLVTVLVHMISGSRKTGSSLFEEEEEMPDEEEASEEEADAEEPEDVVDFSEEEHILFPEEPEEEPAENPEESGEKEEAGLPIVESEIR